MGSSPGCWFSFTVTLCFALHCWMHVGPSAGYSLGNCTIRGSLRESDRPKVLCYKLNYHSVPRGIPHTTKVLDICCNKISVIKSDDLKGLKHLKILNVTKNLISHVEAGAFKDLVVLEELNLARNRLYTIPENFFQGLVQLSTLRLDFNYNISLHSSAFDLLVHLKVLNLTAIHLQHIKEVAHVFRLPSLEKLYVGSNLISSFQSKDVLNVSVKSSSVSNVSFRLQLLDLTMNPLHTFRITEDIFPHLEILDLSYAGNESMVWDVQNHTFLRGVKWLNLSGIHMSKEEVESAIQSVSSSVENLKLYDMKQVDVTMLMNYSCQLPNLAVLRLRKNNLTSLHGHMFQNCQQIRKLDFVENRLHNISETAFRPLQNLINLLLGHNKLTKVPEAIRYLHILDFLDLSFNNIGELTCSDFKNMTHLTSLHLYCNHISVLKACVFTDLPNLKKLLLRANKILTISDAFKSGLKNLQLLELGSNKLSYIRTKDFESLSSLNYLDLIDNQISKIGFHAFKGLGKLSTLLLSSNKITKSAMNRNVFSGINHLKVLEIVSNYISYDNTKEIPDPPFSYLNSLKYLKIASQAHKGLRNIPSNLLQGLSSLEAVHAGNLNIDFLHEDTFKYTPKLLFLDISKNLFTSLNPKVFQKIPRLNKLVLTKGPLHSLDFLIHANLSRVKYLQASRNQLGVINETVIQSLPSLTYLNLKDNTFTCDCSNAWFISWALKNNMTQVLDANGFECTYPSQLRGAKLIDLDTESCTVDQGFLCFIANTILVLFTMCGAFFYHFLRWQVVYAYYLFLAFLYDNKHRKTQKAQSFQYDAFVSYNAQDELWVMQELLPQLEDEQGWKLCLHHRDFQPGRPIMDNIVDGIYGSRKTICLISRYYLESEWCSREIQLASFRLFDEKKDVLVLVFLEDIPPRQLSPYHRMRQLVKKQTYLAWPKPGQDTRVFWCKLKQALEMKDDPYEDHGAMPLL
ncbi:toll-like receptor 22 precursor-like [Scleropages formosus]|uniref:Toll-like receptor 22-like n=1 Tax=Scleropages formosus TaxID=113540 RepID=A0A0P7WAM6_SCLFO|nr:toll-like receptor 22 precursor-like [Scleropages formosus]